jgi:hypothetical protein
MIPVTPRLKNLSSRSDGDISRLKHTDSNSISIPINNKITKNTDNCSNIDLGAKTIDVNLLYKKNDAEINNDLDNNYYNNNNNNNNNTNNDNTDTCIDIEDDTCDNIENPNKTSFIKKINEVIKNNKYYIVFIVILVLLLICFVYMYLKYKREGESLKCDSVHKNTDVEEDNVKKEKKSEDVDLKKSYLSKLKNKFKKTPAKHGNAGDTKLQDMDISNKTLNLNSCKKNDEPIYNKIAPSKSELYAELQKIKKKALPTITEVKSAKNNTKDNTKSINNITDGSENNIMDDAIDIVDSDRPDVASMPETSDDTMLDVTKEPNSDDILVDKFYKKLDNDIEIQDDE